MRNSWWSRVAKPSFTLALAIAGLAFQAVAVGQGAAPEAGAALVTEIVVAGTRLGQRAADSGTSISIIGPEELEALGFGFAVDAIAAAPG